MFATNLVLTVVICIVLRFFWNYIGSPLKAFSGPFPTRFTNIWRLHDVFKGRCDITQNDLHRKYGPAVRMGPNILSISDPTLISQVYTVRQPWLKSDMYSVNDMVVSGVRIKNLFSTQDEKWHSTFIRPVKGLYSMSKVQELEPSLDFTISLFFEKLRERFVRSGRICDMSDYLNFFAWDAMGQITFSETLGILEAGWDHQGFLLRSTKSLDYFASVCQIPFLDLFLDKNPIMRIGPPAFGWSTLFSREQFQKRQQDACLSNKHSDILSKLLELKETHPDTVNNDTVITYLLSNIVAGSDTTASTMCSAVYHVLKDPAVHRKLRDELRAAEIPIPAKWKDLQHLEYLNAVMREAMRINPGVGLMIERVVPSGGFTLPDGRFVPEGTIVGMNPWVTNRNEAVYGAHPDKFIPERWIQGPGEKPEDYEARLAKMKGSDLTFGAGPRVCLGKYLSQLESYKLIAALFSTFDMELPSLNHEWRIINSWFVRHQDIPVRIKERADKAD